MQKMKREMTKRARFVSFIMYVKQTKSRGLIRAARTCSKSTHNSHRVGSKEVGRRRSIPWGY